MRFVSQVQTVLLLLQSDSGLADSDPTRAKEMTAINSVSSGHLICLGLRIYTAVTILFVFLFFYPED